MLVKSANSDSQLFDGFTFSWVHFFSSALFDPHLSNYIGRGREFGRFYLGFELELNWFRKFQEISPCFSNKSPKVGGTFFVTQQHTPWKIKMEHTNHPFRKENDLPSPYDYVPC